MGMTEDAREIAYIEIGHALGDKTADLYKEYFATKKPDEIMSSLKELLSGVLGPTQADQKMKHIQNVLQVYVSQDL